MRGPEATADDRTDIGYGPGPFGRGIRIMRSPSTGGPVEDFSSALFPAGRPGYPGTSPVGGLRMSQDFAHAPVMVDEVVALLGPVPPGVLVDATVGGGVTRRRSWPPIRTSSCWASTATPTRSRPPGSGWPRSAGGSTVRRARFSNLADVAVQALGPGAPVAGCCSTLG